GPSSRKATFRRPHIPGRASSRVKNIDRLFSGQRRVVGLVQVGVPPSQLGPQNVPHPRTTLRFRYLAACPACDLGMIPLTIAGECPLLALSARSGIRSLPTLSFTPRLRHSVWLCPASCTHSNRYLDFSVAWRRTLYATPGF